MIGNELRPMEFIHDHERSLIFFNDIRAIKVDFLAGALTY